MAGLRQIPGLEVDPRTKEWLGPDHPLLRGRCYYVLPQPLLEKSIAQFNPAHLDESVLDLDRRMAQTVDAMPSLAGFWNRRPIHHELLRESPPLTVIDEETLRWLGWESWRSVSQVNSALQEAGDSLARLKRYCRAYCGWLTCNVQFAAEQDQLWRDCNAQLLKFGIPRMGPTIPGHEACPDIRQASEGLATMLAAFEAFLRRWELAQLVGPGLPLPFAPQLPALGPQPGHAGSAVQHFALPRTMPLMPGNQMQVIMEDALGRQAAGEHLKPWMAIVVKGNAAKQTIGRYERLFRLQHYWRVLHDRYGAACARRTGKLELNLAEFLNVEVETIHADLRYIRRELGTRWCRPWWGGRNRYAASAPHTS